MIYKNDVIYAMQRHKVFANIKYVFSPMLESSAFGTWLNFMGYKCIVVDIESNMLQFIKTEAITKHYFVQVHEHF